MRDQCILIGIFHSKAALEGFKADEIGNTRMNMKGTMCEKVDSISVSLCILQHENLAKTVMNL
jgi:hypothetical protein